MIGKKRVLFVCTVKIIGNIIRLTVDEARYVIRISLFVQQAFVTKTEPQTSFPLSLSHRD